jgi:hypothetical protein
MRIQYIIIIIIIIIIRAFLVFVVMLFFGNPFLAVTVLQSLSDEFAKKKEFFIFLSQKPQLPIPSH